MSMDNVTTFPFARVAKSRQKAIPSRAAELCMSVSAETFPQLLFEHAKSRPLDVALRNKRRGIWSIWRWREAAEEVRSLAWGLAQKGINRDDKIAFIGQNIPELYWALLASQCLGCTVAPLDTDLPVEELGHLLKALDINVAVVQDQQHLDSILLSKSNCPNLKLVFFVNERGTKDYDHAELTRLSEISALGKNSYADHNPTQEELFSYLRNDPPTVIVHTGGSTNRPKPIELTQRDLIDTAFKISRSESVTLSDELMAHLPLSWSSAFLFSFSLWLTTGAKLNIPESEGTLFNDMREIGPTFLYGPASFYKKIVSLTRQRMSAAPALDRLIFEKAWEVTNKVSSKMAHDRPQSFTQILALRIANLLVFGPVKNVLGLSRVRVALAGLEPITPENLSVFRAIGINVKLCYCVTESAGCAAICSGSAQKWNVVEYLLNAELELDKDNRILLRRRSSHPRGTEEAWFPTGDVGKMHSQGIQILGRALVPDSNYKIPTNSTLIESILKSSFYIKDVCVFGELSHNLVALLTINKDAVGGWADRESIPYAGYEDLATHPDVQQLVKREISAANEKIIALDASGIARFLILPRELDKMAGELTRYRTVCKPIIIERLSNYIDALMREDVKPEWGDVPVVAIR